jgi:hypothetical protein
MVGSSTTLRDSEELLTDEQLAGVLAYLASRSAMPAAVRTAVQVVLEHLEGLGKQSGWEKKEPIENDERVVQISATQRRAFQRRVKLVEVKIICRVCGCETNRQHYPGLKAARTCSDACKQIAIRLDNAERQRRRRARQQAASSNEQ